MVSPLLSLSGLGTDDWSSAPLLPLEPRPSDVQVSWLACVSGLLFCHVGIADTVFCHDLMLFSMSAVYI